jgi:hypothetical protein
LLVSIPGLDRTIQRGFGDLERPTNLRNRVSLVIKIKGNTALISCECFWSTAFSSSLSGCGQSCLGSFPNEVSFEDMKNEFPPHKIVRGRFCEPTPFVWDPASCQSKLTVSC